MLFTLVGCKSSMVVMVQLSTAAFARIKVTATINHFTVDMVASEKIELATYI